MTLPDLTQDEIDTLTLALSVAREEYLADAEIWPTFREACLRYAQNALALLDKIEASFPHIFQ